MNQYTFFAISCISAKVFEHRCEISGDRMTEENIIYKQNVSRSIGHILYPLFLWFISIHHYYYWFTLSLLGMVIAAMSSQITNLLNLISPGITLCPFFTKSVNIDLFPVLRPSNLDTIHQWQITLLIFNTVGAALNVILNLASDGMDDWRVSACFTFFICLFIYIYCKNQDITSRR